MTGAAPVLEVRGVSKNYSGLRPLRIAELRIGVGERVTVGGIDGDDERVAVAGRSYCGGLCAHWMTLVVRNRPDGWTVTGTTGPIAIA